MSHPLSRPTLRLLSLLLIVAVLVEAPLALSLSRPALAAPTDTPVPVVIDSVEEWAVGHGLLYWAENCYADEFNPNAKLKRKPAAGGAERTLEVIDDFNRCVTYQTLLSSDDGLYYFDNSQERIARMPLGEPYTPQSIKTLTANQFPSVGRPLLESGGYLYWVHFFNKVFRVRKDGSGEVETVADTNATPGDVMVVGNTVYWADNTGIWTTSIACETLPCTETKAQFSNLGPNANPYGLLYQPLGGRFDSYRVYWVERVTSGSNSDYQIRYRTCGHFTVCFVLPPEGQVPPPPDSFYAGPTNWRIGPPLLADNHLFWTEADFSTVNNNNGDVRRKAYNAGTAGADTIATGQARIDDQLFAANDTLFFARLGNGVYSLPLTASAIVRDFVVDGLEVTQAIQNLANSAPLVTNKTTYVRAYGRQVAGPNAPVVEARLTGTKGGAPLPGSPLQPVNGARALTTGGSFDRARLNDSWYFLLPASWIAAGNIVLQLEIDPRRLHSDPNRTNNLHNQPITFQNQPPVCVWTVPVRTHTPRPSTTDPNFWAMISHFNRRWPVPDTWVFRDTNPVEELEVCWWGPFPHPCYGPYELEQGWSLTNGPPDRDKVIVSLWGRALLSFNPDACDNINAPVHFMGMVHPNANNGGMSGYASLISKQSWVQLPAHSPNPVPTGWDSIREGSTMAQELAHNFGRKHVNCGGPDNIDNNYPYPPCQIANTGADSYYGFDVTTRQPIRPNQTADFMSYSRRSWVSDYTWRALLNSFMAVSAASPQGAQDAEQGSSVFVTGLVDTAHNRGEITLVLVLPTASLPPATRQMFTVQAAGIQHDGAPHAVFKLRLLDPVGTVLVERTLTLTELDDHSEESDAALFSDLFPQPTGQVAKIQLLADDTVIDEQTPGVNPPTVTVQQPAGGAVIDNELTIQWSASDPDADDRLLFTVQYSHNNGASWHTLALNLPSTPDPNNSLLLTDLGSLHGSAPNAALIRVLASDGYNTAIATSQPFTLKNRPPEPVILTPGAGQVFPAGEGVLLQGGATDAEDGGLAPDALKWQVNGSDHSSGPDTIVGGLAPGAHTVALSATDSNSQTVTVTTGFQVAPFSVPISTTPSLDGFCDDPSYAAGAGLTLKPYGSGEQANVRVLRSDDYLWVCFSGLEQGPVDSTAFAGVRADIDHSRDPLVQPTDAGFFAGEDGAVFTQAGDGAGSFVTPGPGGLQAQVSAGATSWSAELRIDRATLGGWDHLLGLSFGHYAVTGAGNDYQWPYAAERSQPHTWATTALGSQPQITALEPFTGPVLGPSFALTVTGSGFISGTVVLWDGVELATTVVDDEQLTVEVESAHLNPAGVVAVTARGPEPGNFESNSASFVIQGAAPQITSLAPISVTAGSPALTLTVNGANFAADAQVLWNGTPLATHFVSSTQLTAQVGAPLLDNGQTVGIAVRNQLPDENISSAVSFEVEPLTEQPVTELKNYLPLVSN